VEPLNRWGQGRAEVSPTRRQARNAQRITLRSAGKGSMPGRLIQPLSERVAKRRVSLGVSRGLRGLGKPPKVRAVLPRTPCTNRYRFGASILRLYGKKIKTR